MGTPGSGMMGGGPGGPGGHFDGGPGGGGGGMYGGGGGMMGGGGQQVRAGAAAARLGMVGTVGQRWSWLQVDVGLLCVCGGGGCKYQPKLNQNQRKRAEYRQRR